MNKIFLYSARIVVSAVFIFVFGVLFQWAFHPVPRPDAEAIARARNAAIRKSEQAVITQQSEEQAVAEPTVEPTPEGPTANDLIAAGRNPSDVSLQVLKAGASNAQMDKAASALERMGYSVITSVSKRTVEKTTILTTGAETIADAEALRARDPRFADIGENEGLKADVTLHVLVGDDF